MQRRGEFSAENQFSFANPIQGAGDGQNRLDITEHAAKTEKEDDLKLEARTRRASLNYDYLKHDDAEEEDDSRNPSLSLWKNMGYLRTRSAESSLMHKHPSRAEEISRYRQEMLDLVRDMPESTYELSLRDMVEAPRIAKTVQETIEERREMAKSHAGKGKVKSKGMRKLSRKESVQTGLFLKMFVPIPFGRERRKSTGGSNSCAKVSPKPVLAEADKAGLENMEGEWWKTNELGGSGSSSSGDGSSSIVGSKNTSRCSSRKPVGCYAFLLMNKRRSK